MKYDFYNNSDHWMDGFYELSIEYHPYGDDKRVNEALVALEESRYFNGFWEEKKDFQKHSISLPITIEEESVKSFYGSLSLHNSTKEELPCLITIIRVNGESDWLDISIPQAAFEKVFPYRYPLTTELNPWLEKINDVYVRLAESIYHKSPFDFAMIGEEISGETNQEEITIELMQNKPYMTCVLPSPLLDRLGLNGKGTALSNRLRLF
ncbi:hypothetical protein [Planococcus shenhongbingii]|uniref:Uncharacterized protein n=1 Tax=Planococcus shenhongbingii TaxID=3058398 RepID=A0ABT8NDS1_9BACL|nr:hypothetical protein [Planococcus sp. N017]MDN7245660.1 hypothetical protein [Planococcus sp. N017]